MNSHGMESSAESFASGAWISLELCPNRPVDLNALKTLSACSASVTWHQSGPDVVRDIDNVDSVLLAAKLYRHGYRVLSHLAGRHFGRDEVLKILDAFARHGVRNILAVQGGKSALDTCVQGRTYKGDAERDKWTGIRGELDDIKCQFPFAIDLLRFIRASYGKYFCIGVAGYPEKHPHSLNVEEDLTHLKNKVDAGADFVLTQTIFRLETLKNYIAACRRRGITVPIIPGIFVFSTGNQLEAMASLTSLKVPEYIAKTVSSLKDNDVAVQNFSVHVASSLIREILNGQSSDNRRGGVAVAKRIHLFSLNNLALIKRVYERLGLGNSRVGRYLGPLRAIDYDNGQ